MDYHNTNNSNRMSTQKLCYFELQSSGYSLKPKGRLSLKPNNYSLTRVKKESTVYQIRISVHTWVDMRGGRETISVTVVERVDQVKLVPIFGFLSLNYLIVPLDPFDWVATTLRARTIRSLWDQKISLFTPMSNSKRVFWL